MARKEAGHLGEHRGLERQHATERTAVQLHQVGALAADFDVQLQDGPAESGGLRAKWRLRE